MFIYFLHIKPSTAPQRWNRAYWKKRSQRKKNCYRARLRAFFGAWRQAFPRRFPQLSATWNHSWDLSAGDSETGDQTLSVFTQQSAPEADCQPGKKSKEFEALFNLSCLKIYVGEKWSKSRHNTKNPWKKSRIIVRHLMSLALSLKPLTFNAVSIDYILYLPWNYSNISCVKGRWEVEFPFPFVGYVIVPWRPINWLISTNKRVIEKEQMTWGWEWSKTSSFYLKYT